MAGTGFTFPTPSEFQFIVGDRVNVTWNVVVPLITLYEVCETHIIPLTDQVHNPYSFVWTATRAGYVESGCVFMLVPFMSDGQEYGNNITSVLFGVSKRYTNDPPPTSYNFATTVIATITSTLTSTPVASSTDAASTTVASTTDATSTTVASTTDATSSSSIDHGLSRPAKIGIGIGVSLGVLWLAAAIIGAILLFRRWTIRQSRFPEELPPPRSTDDLAPLPSYKSAVSPRHPRFSQTETVISGMSQISERLDGQGAGELMSTQRAELGDP